jgi:hypothetical protein
METAGEINGIFRFLLLDEGPPVLDIMPGQAEFVEGQYHIVYLTVIPGNMVQRNNQTGMAPFNIPVRKEQGTCTMERTVVCSDLCHLEFMDAQVVFC